MAFPYVGWTEEDHIGRLTDEIHRGQFIDQLLVHAGLKDKVKLRQRLLVRQARHALLGLNIAPQPLCQFLAEQIDEKRHIRPLLVRRLLQPAFQYIGGDEFLFNLFSIHFINYFLKKK